MLKNSPTIGGREVLGIKERRQRQRQQLRDGILAAAREVARAEGWPAVTIRRIAARIEYSPPVIYEYFDSNEDLLLELVRMGYAGQLEAVESAAEAPDGPEEALLGMGRAWLDRKSTRLNSSHANISYAVFCLKKKKKVL